MTNPKTTPKKATKRSRSAAMTNKKTTTPKEVTTDRATSTPKSEITNKGTRPTKAALLNLYAARRFIDSSVEASLGLRISFDVYFQDPLFAKDNPDLPKFDSSLVSWEPGLSDGPTSARFAVVDYNGDTRRRCASRKVERRYQAVCRR